MVMKMMKEWEPQRTCIMTSWSEVARTHPCSLGTQWWWGEEEGFSRMWGIHSMQGLIWILREEAWSRGIKSSIRTFSTQTPMKEQEGMEDNIMINMMIMRIHTWLVTTSMNKPFNKALQINQEQITALEVEEQALSQGHRPDNSNMLVMRTPRMRSWGKYWSRARMRNDKPK